MRIVFRLFTILCLALALGVVAMGQETTGSIEGTVKDPNGDAVPGAQVTVTSKSATSTTGFNRTVAVNDQGFFRMSEVPPGIYSVGVAGTSGFGAATVNEVEVVLGKTTPVNVALPVTGQNVTVDVSSADVSPIDPTDNKIQTNITARTMELLPKGTNFASLLKVAPSTRPEPLNGGYQVDGASGSENTFIVDGQEVTHFRTGVLRANDNLPFQLIQEVQVKSSGFEAEFGGATGGVINVVTKGGSNEWHGEFGAQFRPSRLQANPVPFLRNFRTGAGATFVDIPEYINPPKDKGTDWYPTANLGGPILKDHLFFFASYTPQIFNTHRTINYLTSDPRTRATTESLVYNLKRRAEFADIRLDAVPSDKLRLTGRFIWAPIIDKGAVPAVTEATATPQRAVIGGQTLRGPEFLGQQGGRQNSNNINGSAVWTPTSNLVINVRGGRTFLNEKLGAYGIPTSIRYLCSTASTQSEAVLHGCGQGVQNFATNFQVAYDVSTRKTFDADASYLLDGFAGRHQFKGGYQWNALSNTTDQGYANIGQLTMVWGSQTIANQTGQTPTPGTVGVGILQRFGTIGAASSANQGLFFQDSWQPVSRLSLNLGLRFENETVPSFSAANPGITFGWGSKIAPRLGFAFDLTGDGKTKIFASYGWFYDRFKYELPRGSFGGDFFRRDYFELFPGDQWNTITVAQILGSAPDPVGGTCPDTGFRAAGARSRCQFDFRIPSNLVGGDLFDSGNVDPNIKAARQTDFTIGGERELGGGLLIRGRFTHKNVDRAIEDIGLPTSAGSEAYIIGNPGFGLADETAKLLGFPSVKAKRVYNALEVQIDKRFTKNYYFNANYTLSRLKGNYSGLASSLEFGRVSPNVSRLFDLPWQAFDLNGVPLDDVLPTDRTHVFKLYGAYTADWSGHQSTEFSGFTTAQSGTPLTSVVTLYSLNPTVVSGLGDLGRTEMFTQTDFAIRHKVKFSEKYTFVAEMDFLNLFNERNVLTTQTTISPNNISGANLGAYGCTLCATGGAAAREINTIQSIFNGGIKNAVLAYINDPAFPERKQGTFNQANGFQTQREVRFGFRLLF
ncbi:MAG: carboxypeptidase regulatory-like domain-containing protein [Pyrinomonadaceae bacterium]